MRVRACVCVCVQVETEQVVEAGIDPKTGQPMVSAHVQVRGSVPLFWSQQLGYSPKPDIILQHYDPLYQVGRASCAHAHVHTHACVPASYSASSQAARGLQRRCRPAHACACDAACRSLRGDGNAVPVPRQRSSQGKVSA